MSLTSFPETFNYCGKFQMEKNTFSWNFGETVFKFLTRVIFSLAVVTLQAFDIKAKWVNFQDIFRCFIPLKFPTICMKNAN